MFFNVSLFFAFDYRKNNRLSKGVVIQQQNVTNIKAKGRDCRGVEDANEDEGGKGRDFDIWGGESVSLRKLTKWSIHSISV